MRGEGQYTPQLALGAFHVTYSTHRLFTGVETEEEMTIEKKGVEGLHFPLTLGNTERDFHLRSEWGRTLRRLGRRTGKDAKSPEGGRGVRESGEVQ